MRKSRSRRQPLRYRLPERLGRPLAAAAEDVAVEFAVFEPKPAASEPEPECLAALEKTEPLEAAEVETAAEEIGEPPFDPPDQHDEIFRPPPRTEPEAAPEPPLTRDATNEMAQSELLLVQAEPAPTGEPSATGDPPKQLAWREKERFTVRPLPALTIRASWDRPEMGVLLAAFAADPHVARADIGIGRGGLDGAAARLDERTSADLFIIDTMLKAEDILAGLSKFSGAIARGAKVVVIGDVNDITLLRELAMRGVSYVMLPLKPDELVKKVCRLYAAFDKARVIAVVGARGGVGASTLAHNLAWSIAERQQVSTALVDLDLAFGAAAFQLGHEPAHSIADALAAGEHLDDALLERFVIKQSRKLRLLAAPASVADELELDPQSFDAVLKQVRRSASVVVLDLPHRWTAWIKHALSLADDVVIAAAPDLPSLRNARNILNELDLARTGRSAPQVVLSMAGVPQRPDIPLKDIGEALGGEPILSLPFEPELFGMAAIKGQMLGEAAPKSKVAAAIDEFASLLTGREIVEPSKAPAPEMPASPSANTARPKKDVRARPPRALKEQPALPTIAAANLPFTFAAPKEPVSAPVLDLVQLASDPARDRYLAQMRETAQAELRPRGRRGMLRLIACLLVLAYMAGAWYLDSRNEAAAAPAPRAPARGSLVHAVAHPAAAVTPYEHALQLIAAHDAQGLLLLRRAAHEGFAPAQYRLAKLYETGDGVAADLATARRWTQRAADAGNVRAMHDLGVYYARGDGGERNEAAAFRWFRQAAEFGIADSQYNLGILYQQGRGVRENLAEALFWFTVAAKQNDPAAAARVAALEKELTAVQIEQARGRAEAFRARAPRAEANAGAAALP